MNIGRIERVTESGPKTVYDATQAEPATADERPGGTTETVPQWPDPLAQEAFYGFAGEIVRTIEPHTEASPAALLIQFLVCVGNVIGREAHFVAEGSKHFLNLYTVLVGRTSSGKKGSSWAQVKRCFNGVDPGWFENAITSGLSSGEGLIWAVRDPITKHEPIREKKQIVGYEDVVVDPGVSDKRALVLETEFASPLRMMARDGNTLSVVIRTAWDIGNLRTMTKNSPAKATGAHVSIVGHITPEELRRELNMTEMGNGFANRILWVCTARSKELPEGGRLMDDELNPLVKKLQDAATFARTVGEMKRATELKEPWAALYHEMTSVPPGLLGAVTSRAVPQTMRLACIFAVLDRSAVVRAEHLKAAVAVWEYCFASAKFIFGDALGDPMADTILKALRDAEDGLDRTDLSRLFSHHRDGSSVSRAVSALQELGLARCERVHDAVGRPREVWFAIGATAKKAK